MAPRKRAQYCGASACQRDGVVAASAGSRLELAPATYCASVVEALERFLPTAGSSGFWAVLEPVFGACAFAAGGHQLEQWLDTRSPKAMSFFLVWMRCAGWGARHRRAWLAS